MLIKKVLKLILGSLGIKINQQPLTKSKAFRILKKSGLRPTTVIDVGVHKNGTPELYDAFPDSKLFLIEPVEEFEKDILRICQKRKHFKLIKAAACNRSGKGTLEIDRTKYVHAGLLDGAPSDSEGSQTQKETYAVRTVTLDALCKEENMKGPFLIKIDVDGKDLEVLEGSTEILKETDCVIIEAPLEHLNERLSFLENQGFFLWLIVDFVYVGQILYQVDLICLHNKYKKAPAYRPWHAENFSW